MRPVTGTPVLPGALGGDTIAAGSVAPSGGAYAGSAFPAPPDRRDDEPLDVLDDDAYGGRYDEPLHDDDEEDGARRHRLVVIGLPLLALLVVVALAWWFGKGVISVAGDVDETPGSTPSVSAPTAGSEEPAAPAGDPVPIAGGEVFDPQGDGDPDNPGSVPQAFDGDPATAWSTYEYRGSPAFGNLKDGVGLVLDLGSPQQIAAVTLSSPTPGATVEIRTADTAAANVDSFGVVASGELDELTELALAEPVTARYVLVWLTGLVPSEGGFSASLGEVSVTSAG
ncbi:discoidin domain-containing protein [Blastococcus brunescens]|uniref:Discoidin domain-containing protein n=1 Tax=Blastococcus brunescens TaxID=1564165 RepID=A0ABZ1AYZ7_9ACTN|nr:discoidin domain-containing protein [Blastococcus sp. BMG 8361]WRL63792.1 discoidin domain-containing protein [Blastococcus sp. BMG 8361]